VEDAVTSDAETHYDDGWDHDEWPEPPPWIDDVDYGEPEEVAAKAVASGQRDVPLPNLPDEFWNARPLFSMIRQAAYARGYSADAVLGAVLARASAMISPQLQFDFGRNPGSLNLFVALYGPPASGKSQSVQVAQELIWAPTYLPDEDAFRDGIGLGSGEGLAEVYMGMSSPRTADDDGDQNVRRGASGRSRRTQVRQHAFVYADEGMTFHKLTERKGAALGETIRTAWMGGTLGQANASEETTRVVPRFAYAMGLVIGFQPEPARKLLEGADVGTPQRFLWLSAVDPKIPYDPPDLPLTYRLPIEDGGQAVRGVITCPEGLRRMLRRQHVDRSHGDVEVDLLDGHLPLLQCKLTALLTVLDGRMKATDDDWSLAGLLVETSCAIRDRILEFARQQVTKEIEQREEQRVHTEVAVELAKQNITKDVARHARRIAEKVAADGAATRKSIRQMFNSTTRKWLDPALAHALDMQWVIEESPSLFCPGQTTLRDVTEGGDEKRPPPWPTGD
jgi:hypothetical protein